MNKKYYIVLGIVFALVVGGLFGYAIHTPKANLVGAVGDTNSSQRIAQCVLDMSTTTPTTATTTASGGTNVPCMFNSDSKDRFITSIDYYITALGAVNTSVASSTWKMGTSSDIYNVPAANSQVLNTSIPTTTAQGGGVGVIQGTLFVSSTTPGSTATFPFRIWNTGTYLNLQQNASSTWNATIKVNYFVNN